MKKATRQQTKVHNTQLVLKTIYHAGNISRAEIARVTKLTRPTVSSIVADLIGKAFVEEAGQGPSAGGKRPIMLNIAQNAYQMLCIDLGSQTFQGAVTNLRGDILERASFPTNGRRDNDALTLVYRLIDTLIDKTKAPILGIGIGTPGLIDPQQGIIRQAVNLGWQNLALRDRLHTRYQKPVYISNDGHIAALAEYTFGQLRRQNLILIKIGQGIGAGIVLNGQPYYGDSFGAGEIGHIVVASNNIQCSCGNYGRLETTTSTRAILQQAEAIAKQRPDSALAQAPILTWDVITQALANGDPATRELVINAGNYLGITVANLIGAFNIHHIVISGRVDQFGTTLLTAVQSEAQKHILPSMADETCITYSALGANIVILGSSAMILKYELGVI